MTFIKTADKIIDLFSSRSLSDDDIKYVARYVVLRVDDISITDRMLHFANKLDEQLNFVIGEKYEQDTLF